MASYDFSGWATRANRKCADGRTIMKDAFKDCDGQTVPLCWGHQHGDPLRVLGHCLLENREDGVYAYGTFNDTEQGLNAKALVEHGDITALSIYANQLKHQGSNVIHGAIREVSLVLAGANPGAYIESVIAHGEECEEEAIIYTDEEISLWHAEEGKPEEKESKSMAEDPKKEEGKTLNEVFETLNEEQKTLVYALVGMAAKEKDDKDDMGEKKEEGGNKDMKHNVFEQDEVTKGTALSHADQMDIIELAKQSSVGSLKTAMNIFAENNETLAHGFEDYEELFPEYELLKKGEPETLERDQSWIGNVISKIHKSPISRIRTRHADARIAELRASGYQKKGDYKKEAANIALINRTTDPQTVYIKDKMHRDDIVDITDFDVVSYQWRLMRHLLDEELALAALIGDGREEGDPDKIHETHIRSIWNDEELYTIHQDVDFEAAKTALQGTNTSVQFGENYIQAEAIITSALYAREKYKGSGSLEMYCTPHLLNVMLLARDLNGRRIYSSKADLAAALNVTAIHTVEQFEGKTRTTSDGKTKKLLGLFVNLSDYQFGATRGGEVTKFEDFDIDFNRYTYMLETRLSGSLTKLYSAIALEEDVTE